MITIEKKGVIESIHIEDYKSPFINHNHKVNYDAFICSLLITKTVSFCGVKISTKTYHTYIPIAFRDEDSAKELLQYVDYLYVTITYYPDDVSKLNKTYLTLSMDECVKFKFPKNAIIFGITYYIKFPDDNRKIHIRLQNGKYDMSIWNFMFRPNKDYNADEHFIITNEHILSKCKYAIQPDITESMPYVVYNFEGRSTDLVGQNDEDIFHETSIKKILEKMIKQPLDGITLSNRKVYDLVSN